MPTTSRGYDYVPSSAAADVPYRVNTLADQISTDVNGVADAANAAATTALNSAKSYADTKDTANRTAWAAADTTALNSAKSYADTGDTTALNSAKSYADTGDTTALNSAKSYTDTKDTANRTAWAAADTTALNSAKSYADTGDTSTLAAAKAYADTAAGGAAATALKIMPNLGTEDLDSLKTPGIYPQVTSGNATAGRHYPFTAGGRGYVAVIPISASVVGHEYTATFLKKRAVREFDGVSWSDWVEIGGSSGAGLAIKPNLGTEDLDTLTTPGIYPQVTSGNATLARHYPFEGGGRGYVSVIPVSASVVGHEYTATFLQRRAVREFDGTTWSAWKEIGGSSTAAPTKLVGTALTLSGDQTTNTVTTDYGGRLLLDYGVTIPRWRVHIRNYNLRDGVAFPGALSLVGLILGEAEISNGAPTGRYVAGTTTTLQGAATTPADGSEWVSNWFGTPLDSAKKYMLGYGFTAASGQTVHRGMGPIWNLAGGSAVIADAAVYGSRSTLPPLDIWIECEVPATTRVKGVIGDSLSVGHSSTSPVHDSFLAAHCRAVGALPVFWAASGDTLANFASATATKATRYDGMAKPDVVFMALGGNDIFGSSTDLATTQALLAETLKVVRAKMTTNIVFSAVWPRLDSASAAEDVRQAYNDWLATTLPSGASLYLDTAAPITAAGGRLVDTKWTASGGNIHLSTAGYARVGAVL
jgi:predicted RNA-binding protein with PUA-like domain